MDSIGPKMTAADAAIFMKVSLQNVHKKLKNLNTFKSQNRVYFGFETAKSLFNIDFDHKVISFQIVKGGTGKTSLAHSFAVRANLYGARVLCVDLDQQANLTQAFAFDPQNKIVMIDILDKGLSFSDGIVSLSPGLDLFPSRIENAVLDSHLMLKKSNLEKIYKNFFGSVKNSYDLIIIDCPPALGHSVAAITLASDMVVAPVTPAQFSLSGLKITLEEVQDLSENHPSVRIEPKIVLNKFESRRALSNEVLRNLLHNDIFKNILCNTAIRSCQDFPNATYSNSTVFNSLRPSQAKEDIDLLVREILDLDEKILNKVKVEEDSNG